MKDRRGVEIKVGDIAVHATSGRYADYDVVRVAGFTKKRVRINAKDFLAALTNLGDFSLSRWETGILDPHTLIVVTLPEIENRLS